MSDVIDAPSEFQPSTIDFQALHAKAMAFGETPVPAVVPETVVEIPAVVEAKVETPVVETAVVEAPAAELATEVTETPTAE